MDDFLRAKIIILIAFLFVKSISADQLSSSSLLINLAQTPTYSIVYRNCSSLYCLACASQFICSSCAYPTQPLCCPKYCNKCLNMTYCIQCQSQFALIQNQSTVMCSRITITTDKNNVGGQYCNDGYYFQNITNNCQSCGLLNCGFCFAYQNCTQCVNGYFLYTVVTNVLPVCLKCLSMCAQCNDTISCTICADGYFMKNNFCDICQIQNCLTCSNQTTCTSCISSAFMLPNSTLCSLCSDIIPNCLQCIYNTVPPNVQCTVCMVFYYSFSVTQCLPCPQNCINCSLNSTAQPYCQFCAVGYEVNSITNECVQCNFPCIDCYQNYQGQYLCGACSPGFFLNPNAIINNISSKNKFQCLLCNIQNCLTCNNEYTCTLCQQGYYLQTKNPTSSTQGQPTENTVIVINCGNCTTNCTTCKMAQIYPNSTISTLTCTSCIDGYYIKGLICVICNISSCLICDPTNSGNCLQCVAGYYLSSGQCNACELANCQVCQSSSGIQNCTKCLDGFGFNLQIAFQQCDSCQVNCISCLNNTYCLQCQQKYYIVDNRIMAAQTCEQCQQQCLTCDQNGCIFCQQGYYSSPIQTLPNNVECISCKAIKGCVSCINSQFCKQCTNITFSTVPTIYGNCSSCPVNCIACTAQLKCTLCQVNFLLLKQTNTCYDTEGLPIWGIFVCSAFGLSIIFVVAQIIKRKIRLRRLRELDDLEQTLNNNITVERNDQDLQLRNMGR